MEGEDFYSVEEAARVLQLTPGRIRQMLRAGELEGVPPEESGGRGWKIPMHAVHDRHRPARVASPPKHIMHPPVPSLENPLTLLRPVSHPLDFRCLGVPPPPHEEVELQRVSMLTLTLATVCSHS
jgi:excisionase family DNA binding protein